MPHPPRVEKIVERTRRSSEQSIREGGIIIFGGVDRLVDRQLRQVDPGRARAIDEIAQPIVATAAKLEIEQSFPQPRLARVSRNCLLEGLGRLVAAAQGRKELG